MAQRSYSFLVVLLLIFGTISFGQSKPVVFDGFYYKSLPDSGSIQIARPGHFGRLVPIQKNFYSSHLGFFCRKELQLEKATSLPLRVRLGSLNYTNYLEGKDYFKF